MVGRKLPIILAQYGIDVIFVLTVDATLAHSFGMKRVQKKTLNRRTENNNPIPYVPEQEKHMQQPPSSHAAQQLAELSRAMEAARGVQVQEVGPTTELGDRNIVLPGQEKAAPEQPSQPVETKEEEVTVSEEQDDEEHYMDNLLAEDERTSAFNNPKRRRQIEGALQPIKPEDLADHLEYRQVVKTEFASFYFRSPAHSEVEEIYRWIILEGAAGMHGVLRLSGFLACAGTVSIMGKELPSHLDEKGRIDRGKFDKKYEVFSKFPFQLVEDCRVQFSWFDKRIAKLLTGGLLGNG